MNLINTEKIYKNLCEKIYKVFPHIENLSVFYKSELGINLLNNNSSNIITDNLLKKINFLRSSSLQYQWILPIELEDFGILKEKKIHQLDLLDEYENRVLILNFKSEIDQFNDFACITFPVDITFLGMYKSVKNLTTDDKILIGELLSKICNVNLESEKENIEFHSRLSTYFELKTNSLKSSSNELIAISYLKNEIKNNLNNKLNLNFNFEFTKELIQYILDHSISLVDVTHILFEAFKVISILEKPTSDFEFDFIHLKLINNDSKQVESRQQQITEPKDKIEEILDKLELAAEKADNDGVIVNGKTVAHYLIPPVSPPAVTEILKKNITKIEIRMNEFPNKWSLIRKHLKPLRELEFKHQFNFSKKIG